MHILAATSWLVPMLKLILAALLGAVVGWEREKRDRPAGLRTHMLVCVASALLVIVAQFGAVTHIGYEGQIYYNADPARMATGIIMGIGFLGAGTIIRKRDKANAIKGLTTAASIWLVAAIGIAIGFNAYLLSVFTALLVLVILTTDAFRKK
jgi:putative Mg2+ transporter-C (MgtC) family protein